MKQHNTKGKGMRNILTQKTEQQPLPFHESKNDRVINSKEKSYTTST